MTSENLLGRIRVGSYGLEEVRGLVPIHLEAFRGYPNGRLGRGYARAALSFYCTYPGAIALACWMDDRAVGYVCGVDYDQEDELGRAVRWAGVRGVVSRPWLVFDEGIRGKVLTRVLGIFRKPTSSSPVGSEGWPRPVMGLVAIGVAGDARGTGVGGRLLAAFEARCRERGFASMLLSVYSDNGAARRLYEGCGWQAVATVPGARTAIYYLKTLDER